MPLATPTTSKALFDAAVDALQGARTLARTDPLVALIGILLKRDAVMVGGQPARSIDLERALWAVFGKSPPFDDGKGATAFIDLFTGVKVPGANDWRNAFGSQKGLGCFASVAELQQAPFRFANREQCPHRVHQAANNEYYCDLSNGTVCKSRIQHAGEVPKLLRRVPITGNLYGYDLVIPEADDLRKLLTSPTRIPLLPVMAAIYAGAEINRGRAAVSQDEFFADLGLPAATAGALFDDDPNRAENQRLIRMTEPYLLSSLRRKLHDDGFIVSLGDLVNFHLSLKPRAFVILSGISGTGKSLLPRLYANAIRSQGAAMGDNLTMVPVRPGWNDVGDLMGFYNAIHQGFQPGPAVDAFKKSDQASDAHGEMPAVFILDELNLARVEHYFADFLSVMETRREVAGQWVTDQLQLAPTQPGLVNYVGVANPAQPFVDGIQASLPVPDNLFVVGTVNIDESTQGISSKILDRANTIEFEDVTLTPPAAPAAPATYAAADLHLLGHALCARPYRRFADVQAAHPQLTTAVIAKLEALQTVLKVFRLHFGHRTRDEVCIYLAYASDLVAQAAQAQVDLEGFDIDDAFDRQVLQKVLPRVSGTREELQFTQRGNLFDQLDTALQGLNCPKARAKVARMREQEVVNFWEA